MKLCDRRISTTTESGSLRNNNDVTKLNACVCLFLNTKATLRGGSKGPAVGRITLWWHVLRTIVAYGCIAYTHLNSICIDYIKCLHFIFY